MNNERLYLIMKDDLYGYMNRAGEVVIKPQYENAYGFNDEGITWVKKDFRWLILHQDGKEYYPPHVHVFHDVFSDGLCSVLIDGKYGYVDKWGKIAIKPEFDFAFNFSEGLAQVLKGKTNYQYHPEEDMLAGFIDKSGRLVIDYKFSNAYKFTEGLAAVVEDKLVGYIDKTGEYVIEPKFEVGLEFSEGLAPVGVDDKYGYIDKTGEIKIEPKFFFVSGFKEGLAAVILDEGIFIEFINKNGEFVIPPKFDKANDFQEGYASVLIGKKAGYINKQGGFKIFPQYDFVSSVVDGLGYYVKMRKIWLFFQEQETGYIDMDNNKIRIMKKKIDKLDETQNIEMRKKNVNYHMSFWNTLKYIAMAGLLGPFASIMIINIIFFGLVLSDLNHLVLKIASVVLILIAGFICTKLSINSFLKEHTIINSKSQTIISSLMYFIIVTFGIVMLFSAYFNWGEETDAWMVFSTPIIVGMIIILTAQFSYLTFKYFHKYRYGFVNDFVFSDFIKYGDKIILKANYEMFPKIRKYLRKSRKSKDEIKEIERTSNRVDLSGFHEELRIQENLAKQMKFQWDIYLREKFPESQFDIEIGSDDLNYYITCFRSGKTEQNKENHNEPREIR